MKGTNNGKWHFFSLLLCVVVAASGCQSMVRFQVVDALTCVPLGDYSIQWGQVVAGFPKASAIIETNIGTIATTNIVKIKGVRFGNQNAFVFKKAGYQNACVTITPHFVFVNSLCSKQTNCQELSMSSAPIKVPLFRQSHGNEIP